MKAVILAAGMGRRLGCDRPKCLLELDNGFSIMQHQIKNLNRYLDICSTIAVVGYAKELIMEGFPDLTFVYNEKYERTNTARSLLKALRRVEEEDVLWLNGDIVFDHRILERILKSNNSCMAVNTSAVGEEEIKYRLDKNGFIEEVSKEVRNGLGEAVGINFVQGSNLTLLRDSLEECSDNDYFEKGIELAVEKGLEIRPVDISDFVCIEIDFAKDLEKANLLLKTQNVHF